MATRLIGTDDADPRLPALVVAATQGTTAADLAPGDIGARVTWTAPISAGITIGAGTTTANYARVGDIVVAAFRFVLGAGSAIISDVQLAVPVPVANLIAGSGFYFDSSSLARYDAAVFTPISTTALVRVVNTAATYPSITALNSTTPFTWAINDEIAATLTYLVA